jgi:ParB-like chromosome segregation protein Spo0J
LTAKGKATRKTATTTRKGTLKKADGVPVYCSFTSLVKTESVVPNPRNPNQHPDDQIELLAKIIDAQGWRNPIVVSDRSGFITKGHGRLLAAQHLGKTLVPVDVQHYENEAAEHADLIADNRIAELSEMDRGALAELIAAVDDGTIDTDLTGYLEGEIEALLTAAGDVDPDTFADLDAEAERLSGKAPNVISIEVPLEHVDAVATWLANGEPITAPGMGKGVLNRCGLL